MNSRFLLVLLALAPGGLVLALTALAPNPDRRTDRGESAQAARSSRGGPALGARPGRTEQHSRPARAAADWPMFRGGPQLRGVAALAVPPPWKLAWSFRTGGDVDSSAAIRGGRVFIGSDDGHLYCLDAENGAQVWKFKTEGAVNSSPCVAGGAVYFGSSDGFIYAVDAATGRERWRRQTDGKVLASPILVNGRLLVGSYDNFLYCLEPSSGDVIWKLPTDNYVHASAASDGRIVAVTGCDGRVRMASLETGHELTSFDSKAPIPPAATLYDGVAYVGGHAQRFFAIGCDDGRERWSYANDAEPDIFQTSAAVNDELVVFGGRDQHVHAVERASGRRRWMFKTGGEVDSSPVIAGNMVLVGSSDGILYALSLADGTQLGSYAIGAEIRTSPAVGAGLIVIGAADGVVYAFAPAAP